VKVSKDTRYLAWLLGGVAALVGLMWLTFVLFLQGKELARTTVAEGETATLQFSVQKDSPVELFAEVDLVTDVPLGDDPHVHDLLPHALDLVITVARGDEILRELECNPLDAEFTEWVSKGPAPDSPLSLTRARFQFFGRMPHCTFTAAGGDALTVQARRVWVLPSWRDQIQRVELAVKLPGAF
jgi:hypothetical protein